MSDQSKWWEVRKRVIRDGRTRWVYVSDHDTFERAEIARKATQAIDPDGFYRSHQVRGQA